MLLDFVSQLCYESHQPCASRGVSGDGPVGGARRGVPRRRLVTVSPGRPGTPSARHYDLAARSSLHGSGGNAGDGSTGPRPKIATVERREARVPPLRGARRLASAWRAASRHVAGAAAPERRLGAPPPLGAGQSHMGEQIRIVDGTDRVQKQRDSCLVHAYAIALACGGGNAPSVPRGLCINLTRTCAN